jgi:hypothetical protein
LIINNYLSSAGYTNEEKMEIAGYLGAIAKVREDTDAVKNLLKLESAIKNKR